MAYWNSKESKIIHFNTTTCKEYPSWEIMDCGCCMGLQWSSGYYPIECDRCNGSGFIYRHIKSGVLSQYPGGPFLGRDKYKEG